MDEFYYCGFNGFGQVPSQPENQLTTLVCQNRMLSPSTQQNPFKLQDVAICWNYLVLADSNGGLIKYGLVNGKPGQSRLGLPPGAKLVKQVSATPRHLLAVTDTGDCWAHEESKGWRMVTVGSESVDKESLIDLIDDDVSSAAAAAEESANDKDNNKTNDNEHNETQSPHHSPAKHKKNIEMRKTSCGDAHNLGLDADGVAYALPSPLTDWGGGLTSGGRLAVTDVVCGKEHCLLLTEHGQVFSWGGGSRGQLGHGNLLSEERPRLVMALDGMRIRKIAAGGWHSACISQFDDLYMFGWNESGQLAQPTGNLVKPAECFSAVEKLFMACCTMQPEDDAALPRSGDADDEEVYHKNNDDDISTVTSQASMSFCGIAVTPSSGGGGGGGIIGNNLVMNCGGGNAGGDNPLMSFNDVATDPADISFEKDDVTCYRSSCSYGDTTDLITVQSLPMLVSIPTASSGSTDSSAAASGIADVDCGSRHTVVLTRGSPGQLWAFGWNKYGQLGLGHNASRDAPEKMVMPRLSKGRKIKMVRAGDWGTAVITTPNNDPPQ